MKIFIRRCYIVTLIGIAVLAHAAGLFAAAGDTIRVKTLTFNDITKRSGTWLFPPPDRYQKVLMEYTLKCDSRTTQDQYPCGEWDYLTYTILTDSTGEFDSTRAQQVNYVVRGNTPDSFPYSVNPVYEKKKYKEFQVPSAIPANLFTVGSGGLGNNSLFKSTGGRLRFIWTASELDDAGMSAGEIDGMVLKALDSVGTVKLFTVMMGQTILESVSGIMSQDNLTTVCKRNLVIDDGENFIAFHSGFAWDGTSNIIIDISCIGSDLEGIIEAGPAASSGLVDDGSRRAFQFTTGDKLIVPASIGDDITNEVTVAFWSFGTQDVMPKNHNTLEAFDVNGNRVMNIHSPWGDGTVYWDAGRNQADGNVDRIQRAAIPENYENSWNHWAFVKNATTGMMRIYLNGELFVEGSGKTTPITGIARLLVGSGNAGSYDGFLDEIQIWNKALDQATIQQWMKKRINNLHPYFSNLLSYYSAETESRPLVADDESEFGRHAQQFGSMRRAMINGTMLGYLTNVSTSRPLLKFEQGAEVRNRVQSDVVFPMEHRVTHVIKFDNPVQPRIYYPSDNNHPGNATDTLSVYAAGWLPIVNEAGSKIDSEWVTPSQTLRKEVKPYFSPIVQFEIGRYITPYGIGLDLGPNGFKWIYDVTDFAPLLRNNVTLSAGNQQELIDLTFVFIKGTPARDVKQIDQVWYERGATFPAVLSNSALAPVEVPLNPDAQTFRLKAVTSGHEFSNATNCAEFCPREHFFSVDGTERFKWTLWKECGDNPVYPQGGTWLIDRTGWCPGAPVDLYEFELTPYAAGKNSVTIDYGVKKLAADESWGRWEVSGQLIGYGAPNRALDAELFDVITPNSWEFYQRLNPICGQPIIVLRNSGSVKLTSCTITYGVEGGVQSSFQWTGDLDFLERDTLTLPIPVWAATEGMQTFIAKVSTPNGDVDQYGGNDEMRTLFVSPPVYYNDLQIVLRTNNQAAAQYEWRLKNIDGTVLGSGMNLADNTTYTNDFALEDGCYDYELINKEGYGLDFWFLRSQLGSGSLTFKSGGLTIKTFEPDFDNRAWMQFSVGPKPTISVSADTLFFLTLPNVKAEKTFAITSVTSAPLRIDSVIAFSLRNHFTIENTSMALPATLLPGDTLYVTVGFLRTDLGATLGNVRIFSNDERSSLSLVRLVGNAVVTDVEERGVYPLIGAEIGVVPNPVVSSGEVILEVADVAGADKASNSLVGSQCRLVISDMLGRVEEVVFDGILESSSLRFAVPPTLPVGSHVVALQSAHGVVSAFFTRLR